MGPTWVLSAPDGPNAGPMNLAIREAKRQHLFLQWVRRVYGFGCRTPIYCPRLRRIMHMALYANTYRRQANGKPWHTNALDLGVVLCNGERMSSKAIIIYNNYMSQKWHVLYRQWNMFCKTNNVFIRPPVNTWAIHLSVGCYKPKLYVKMYICL